MSTSPVSACWTIAGARPLSSSATTGVASSAVSLIADPLNAPPLASRRSQTCTGRTGTPLLAEVLFGLGHAVRAVVEDAGRQNGVRLANLDSVVEMRQHTDPAAGYHRYSYPLGYHARVLQIVPALLAVSVHARYQQLAGSQLRGPLSPPHCVHAGGPASPMGVHLPPGAGSQRQVADQGRRRAVGGPLRGLVVDGHNDALGAEEVRRLP